MSAAILQDFTTYAGDAISPVWTVLNAAGTAVDISTSSNITWTLSRNAETATVLTKTKAAGQISFVTNGADGKFQVSLLKTDTAALSGYYFYTAAVLDAGGNPTTVATGRMQVGVLPQWTYDSTQLTTNPLYQVRLLLGDTVESDQQFQDGEILFYLASRTPKGAAAECCRTLATRFSRSVDYAAGMTRIKYGDLAKAYALRAIQFDAQSAISGAGMPYAGGISVTDKQNQETDTDRVDPQFNLGLDDNEILPIAEVGNQTLDGVN